MIQAGEPAPDFSRVCSDQLSAYQEIKAQLDEKNVEMVG